MSNILTKYYIKKLGYEVEEVAHRIFLIKNFITNEEYNELIYLATSATDDEWKDHYLDGAIKLAELKFGRTDIDNLVKEGLYEITEDWADKNLKISHLKIAEILDKRLQKLFDFRTDLLFNGCGTIQRQYEGVPLKDHVDNHTDPSLEYAAVLYLNDNYFAGEVYFVNQNIELKPDSRSLLIFPSTEGWRHGVNPPGPGPHRYVLPSFVSRKDFWEINKDNGYNVDKTLEDTNFKE